MMKYLTGALLLFLLVASATAEEVKCTKLEQAGCLTFEILNVASNPEKLTTSLRDRIEGTKDSHEVSLDLYKQASSGEIDFYKKCVDYNVYAWNVGVVDPSRMAFFSSDMSRHAITSDHSIPEMQTENGPADFKTSVQVCEGIGGFAVPLDFIVVGVTEFLFCPQEVSIKPGLDRGLWHTAEAVQFYLSSGGAKKVWTWSISSAVFGPT